MNKKEELKALLISTIDNIQYIGDLDVLDSENSRINGMIDIVSILSIFDDEEMDCLLDSQEMNYYSTKDRIRERQEEAKTC